MDNPQKEPDRIHAEPTKEFFVNMITRDISLQDCIFDLLDNSVDGARRHIDSEKENPFQSFEISIKFDENSFAIDDNCRGISLSDAIDYAFHFGKRPGSHSDTKGGIGLYGIGMKRAIFKMGKSAKVLSKAETDSFEVSIDVDKWLVQKKKDTNEEDWDFDYKDVHIERKDGVQISISNLYEGIKDLFGDPGFKNEIKKMISRDYSFFIEKGLTIKICGENIKPFPFNLRTSDQFIPEVYKSTDIEDPEIQVRIVAGIVSELEDDLSIELKPLKVERSGWFIVCNDRVVLAADKSIATVWGNDDFPIWHPQYNGFAGFVFFNTEDPSRLPWTTTKRNLDLSSPLYMRTLTNLKKITRKFIDYTNQRKSDTVKAKSLENACSSKKISELTQISNIKFPRLSDEPTTKETTWISFQKPRSEIDKIKELIGKPGMKNSEFGLMLYDYFLKSEVNL